MTDRSLRGRQSGPSALAAIGLGGALGTVARYGVAQLVHVAPDGFPWATFAVNVTGSFALGFILALSVARFPPSSYAIPFVATGFLGGYTTFSALAVDVVQLIQHGRPSVAILDASGTMVAGLIAAWAGVVAARSIVRPPARSQALTLEAQQAPLPTPGEP